MMRPRFRLKHAFGGHVALVRDAAGANMAPVVPGIMAFFKEPPTSRVLTDTTYLREVAVVECAESDVSDTFRCRFWISRTRKGLATLH